jgi:hypothetical protein
MSQFRDDFLAADVMDPNADAPKSVRVRSPREGDLRMISPRIGRDTLSPKQSPRLNTLDAPPEADFMSHIRSGAPPATMMDEQRSPRSPRDEQGWLNVVQEQPDAQMMSVFRGGEPDAIMMESAIRDAPQGGQNGSDSNRLGVPGASKQRQTTGGLQKSSGITPEMMSAIAPRVPEALMMDEQGNFLSLQAPRGRPGADVQPEMMSRIRDTPAQDAMMRDHGSAHTLSPKQSPRLNTLDAPPEADFMSHIGSGAPPATMRDDQRPPRSLR